MYVNISTNVKNIEIYITNAVCISSPSSLIGISLHKSGLDTDRKSYTSHESHNVFIFLLEIWISKQKLETQNDLVQVMA